MKMTQQMEKFAPILLRIGMAVVIVWFGVQQMQNPSPWIHFLPSWIGSLPIAPQTFVLLNGWFEVTFGLALLAGLYTRFVALLLGLHLLGIAASIGYGPLGVRDFGLAIATLTVFLAGAGQWSLDAAYAKNVGEQGRES